MQSPRKLEAHVSCPSCCALFNGLYQTTHLPTDKCIRYLSCPRSVMNTTAAKANELEKRITAFAAAIVSLSSKPPRTVQGRHICTQILRSRTAVAANYGEARGAESRADFIHKLKIVFKELNETTIW